MFLYRPYHVLNTSLREMVRCDRDQHAVQDDHVLLFAHFNFHFFAILGSYAFVHACRCLVKTGPLGKALSWCGNNSMELLFLHGIVQPFVCAPLKLEPFRMSIKSEESDYRTFLVLALEILFTMLLVLVIKSLKKKMSRKV